jgi:hypothetical protein
MLNCIYLIKLFKKYEAVSVVSLTSSSGGYINGRNSANLELLIDRNTIFEGLILLFYNHPCYGTLPSRVLFYMKIINFPNMCSNIPASPAYGVYISQLIRYARASSNYSDFLKRHLHLRNRLLDQGYKKIRFIRKFCKSRIIDR